MKSPRSAFTLIELLVVIAIIAVLSVVVVLSLNPSELLRQSRDANRLSDLSTLNSALALYTTDQAGVSSFSLGNASSVYVSLPDTSSTCGTWNLPALPSGYTYACVASTSSKNINNTGWIPVNFSNISGGAPFSNLPLDGVNQSSTGLYYTYYSNGSQFMVTAIPESQKQKTALGAKSIIQNYPDAMANGSSLTISPLFSTSGLVGYWPMDEGAGTTAYDLSGNNNTGTLCAGVSCLGSTVPSWVGGKVGSSALSFDGSTNWVSVPNGAILQITSSITVCLWFSTNSLTTQQRIVTKGWNAGGPNSNYYFFIGSNGVLHFAIDDVGYNDVGRMLSSAGTWYHTCGTFDGNNRNLYTNGTLSYSLGQTATINTSTSPFAIGSGPNDQSFSGLIDDVRIYNRALSPAEIQAIYNAER